VVCKPDSRTRIAQLTGAARRRSLALLPQCRYQHVQAAVDAARPGTRILVLPGVYREEPSRAVAFRDPRCADLLVPAYAAPTVLVASYAYQQRCPNDENLVAILGKRDIQIEGTGDDPSDVLFDGDRDKLNVIRADRADGVVLRNFTVQYSDFNNVYVIETNGFRLDRIVSRWSREYGFLSFVSDHGLYTDLVAYGNGDAGVYPGAGPQGHCVRYGIEIRRVDSYRNTLGYSGTVRRRDLGTPLALPPQRGRNLDGLRIQRPSGNAAGLLEVRAQPDLLEQRRSLQRAARRVLQAARAHARPEGAVPNRARPCRHRSADRGRQRERRPRQLDLRQLALRDDALLGPSVRARRDQSRTCDGHVAREPVRGESDERDAGRDALAERARLLVGRGGERELLGAKRARTLESERATDVRGAGALHPGEPGEILPARDLRRLERAHEHGPRRLRMAAPPAAAAGGS